MSKRLVGLIVATVIIVVLLLAVFIGGLRLKKQDDNKTTVSAPITQTHQNSTEQRQPVNNNASNGDTSTNNSNFNSQTSTQSSPTSKPSSTPPQSKVSNNNDSKQTVQKVLEQSKQVKGNNTYSLPEGSVAMTPSNAELLDGVYEMNGIVESIGLVDDTNGIQSAYKVVIKIPMGDQTIFLDYVTTSNSLNVLKRGTAVAVQYQLTNTDKIVVKGLSLLNQ
jgi:cytoskeletal protein RodZ